MSRADAIRRAQGRRSAVKARRSRLAHPQSATKPAVTTNDFIEMPQQVWEDS